jgi:hypothetical protein
VIALRVRELIESYLQLTRVCVSNMQGQTLGYTPTPEEIADEDICTEQKVAPEFSAIVYIKSKGFKNFTDAIGMPHQAIDPHQPRSQFIGS